MEFTLLSRAYCSLCSVMEEQLATILAGRAATLHVVDVDAFPDLAARWGDLVPVLFAGAVGADNEVCHYHLDCAAVERTLRQGGGAVAADPRIG